MDDKAMDIYEYGNSQASIVLIQMVGEHDLPGIEREITEIRRLTDMDFKFIAVKVNNWNQDLSPWNAAAASPSIWFPGFLEYLKRQKIQSDCIYLSLGDKEEKTRNSVMAQVGDCIRQAYTWLNEEGIQCTLEWNQGGHFKEPDLRMARAFAWVMKKV